MQVGCQQVLAARGFVQYEVSAYARGGRACAHNLNYWQFGDYLGIGAGAHGKLTASHPTRWRAPCACVNRASTSRLWSARDAPGEPGRRCP